VGTAEVLSRNPPPVYGDRDARDPAATAVDREDRGRRAAHTEGTVVEVGEAAGDEEAGR